MDKECSRCKKTISIDDFGYKHKASGKRHSHCRACGREMNRAHYRANVQYYVQKAARNNVPLILGNRRRLWKYLIEHPCVDCGEVDPVVLQFDHVVGQKKAAISTMMSNCNGWVAIEAEITKCVVRCANCHVRVTAGRAGYWKVSRPRSSTGQSV